MSACDSCPKPGACCHGFSLNNEFTAGIAPAEVERWITEKQLPFYPLERFTVGPTSNIREGHELWRFGCRNLLPSGRCGDYEHRPQLCRAFVPGSDRLCVIHLDNLGHP